MKTKPGAKLARGGFLLTVAAAALGMSGGAFAAGTAAGTNITNKATLSYSVGTVNQADIASSPTGSTNGTGANTVFLVDNKIVHTVTTSNTAPVSSIPGALAVVTSFTVSNTGNATQDYALAIANLANGQTIFTTATDNFDVATGSCTVQVGGVTQGYVLNLLPDASANVTVTCPIPAAQPNGDIAGISLTAAAATAGSNGATLVSQSGGADNPTAIDIVFADAAGSDDSARDGRASARSAYQIVTAALTVTKSFTTQCDPLNLTTAPKSIPGSYVRYAITIVNNGTASASLGTMTDVLNTNLDFDPDLITGAGTCASVGGTPTSAVGTGFMLVQTNRGFTALAPKYMTTSANGDGATHNLGTLTFDFAAALPTVGTTYTAGELKPGESVQVTYQVRIK